MGRTVPINRRLRNKATGIYDSYIGKVEKLPNSTHVHPKLESPKSPSIMAPDTTETRDITARTRELDISFCVVRHSDSFIIL